VGHELASIVGIGEAGFRLVAEHLPGLAVVAFDRDLGIRAAAGTVLRDHGVPPQELVGREVPELAVPVAAGPLAAAATRPAAGRST
jgi:hypothetical protein